MSAGQVLPPINRMTDRCKNFTLATTSLRPVIMLSWCTNFLAVVIKLFFKKPIKLTDFTKTLLAL